MTYEYVCEACGHQWEAEQSIKESPLKKCVSCSEDRAKRLISGGTGFLLKGGGWYADLYGSPGSGAAKSGGDDKASKSNTAGAKAESSDPKGTSTDTKSTGDGKAAASTSTPSAPTTTATPAASNAKAS
jgi:putative FmdB family regulatory protein